MAKMPSLLHRSLIPKSPEFRLLFPAGKSQATAAIPTQVFNMADIPKEKMEAIIIFLTNPIQSTQETLTAQPSAEEPAQSINLVAPATFEEVNELLSLEGSLTLDSNYSIAQAIEAWLTWRVACFANFESFKVPPDLAAQALKANLPNPLRTRIGRVTPTMIPEKVVGLVNSQLIGSIETFLVFFEGISYLISNRVTSSSELMQKVNI